MDVDRACPSSQRLGALGALCALAVAFWAAPAGADDSTILHIDQRQGTHELSDVVTQVRDACRSADSVAVAITLPKGRFSADIDCRQARVASDPEIAKPLLAGAARHNNAGAKADKVIAVQESVPATPGLSWDHDLMVWSFAAGQPQTCRRANSKQQITTTMASGAENSGETPEQWALIEAVMLAGACPAQLPHLFHNLSALGHRVAADTVKHLIHDKAASLALGSVPQGISARTIAEQNVFLNREGHQVAALLTDPHGTPGLHVLWWCPQEHLFVEPAHGAAFDANGKIIGGPAERGLDQLKTTVEGSTVTVHLHQVIPGSTTRHDRTPSPGSQSVGPWNTTPASFCFQPTEGG